MDVLVPKLFVKSRGDKTTRLSLMLTKSPRRVVVRLTGGCGEMSGDDAEGLYALFAEAFAGFDGALLFGGSRMISRDDHSVVVPGITEIPTAMRRDCPNMVTLGVVPRTEDLGLADYGMIISREDGNPYVTIVHPEQDIALVVQVSADDAEVWDAEYQECLRITQDLREYAGFTSILVCYNGGSVTERELLATAQRGWPVILVDGSGRKTEAYAHDEAFLTAHPNVRVCDRNATSLRDHLAFFDGLPPQKLRLLRQA